MKKVLLFFLLMFSLACRKNNNVSPSPKSYTSKMAGIRTWHGKSEDIYKFGIFDSVLTGDIKIIFINDFTIVFNWLTIPFHIASHDTLHYISCDNVKKTLYYSYLFRGTPYFTDTLIYDYFNDSMTFHQIGADNNTAFKWDVKLHTP